MMKQQQILTTNIVTRLSPTAVVLILIFLQQVANGARDSASIQPVNSTQSNNTKPANEQDITKLGGNCATKSSCKTRGRRLELDGGSDKRPCYCDARCAQYDDCCSDSPWADPIEKRTKQVLVSRNEWHCHRVNPIFGDVLLKASCSAQWLASVPKNEASTIQRRCEYMRQLRPGKQAPAEQEADPVGMMMPITDLNSGITYANSYCLRCNKLAETVISSNSTTRPKLMYWSPMLECNYNLDVDDRNSLFDLISANKGQALHFSPKQNKWLIDVGRPPQNMSREQVPNSQYQNKSERVCSITPTIPDSVEHMVRFCKINTIDSCPDKTTSASSVTRECELGHQSLTYGQVTNLVYRNLACATCNNDTNVFCEPRLKKTFPFGGVTKVVVDKQQPDKVIHPPGPDELPTEDELSEDLSGKGAGRGGHGSSTAISGSFSVLLDLYGSSQGDEQVGSIHLCPDPLTQVYDPFYLGCRDIVCGFHHKLVDGNCAPIREQEQPRGSLVEKFEPAMAQVTTVCLLISIASLGMYLFLYVLSMIDLRPLLVDMAQWDRLNHNPLEKQRGSKASMSSSRSQSQSQNLSSRGVACLAASLLAAYLLFIAGHRQAETNEINQTHGPAFGCRTIAVATYYFFLVAFTWMFVLSYDIWRILRLATCQLRAPALHSQTGRFLAYTLFTQLTAGLIVASSVLVDLAPITCSHNNYTSCTPLEQELTHFIHNYRPKFGHHLGSCWFSNRRSLALFFGLPVALIMLANVIFFVHSSYMVIRTSSGSSKKRKSGKYSPTGSMQNSRAPQYHTNNACHPPLETRISSISAEYAALTQQQQLSHDNSEFSAQTLESHLSEESSCGGESPQIHVPHVQQPQLIPEDTQALPSHKHRLEPSQSSSSLATNQSVTSGSSSLSAHLALKYDAHLQTLSSLMSSIVKDYRLYCRLSTIMGLTWLTGLMASIVDQSEILWYLFVVLNTLQGLFIFIAFGCKQSKLRNLEVLMDYVQYSWQKRRSAKNQHQSSVT